MKAAMLRALLLALALGALLCLSVSAQGVVRPVIAPDAFVRGTGVAALADNIVPENPIKAAMFRIDVARYPDSTVPLRGGFQIRELAVTAATSVQRTVMIVSRRVTAMTIEGNTAVIRAEGVFNGRPACLTLEVGDDTAGDWIRVRADGCMLDVIYYDKDGGVKQGDIRVWQKPVLAGFTKGVGSINVTRPGQIGPNVGNFEFLAENTTAGPRGRLLFREINPRALTPVDRPLVTIQLPAVQELALVRNRAVFHGEGTMTNATGIRRVIVSVVAVDNRPAGPIVNDGVIVPDTFAISVNDPLMPSFVPLYYASGPLTRGDIVVAQYAITPL